MTASLVQQRAEFDRQIVTQRDEFAVAVQLALATRWRIAEALPELIALVAQCLTNPSGSVGDERSGTGVRCGRGGLEQYERFGVKAGTVEIMRQIEAHLSIARETVPAQVARPPVERIEGKR